MIEQYPKTSNLTKEEQSGESKLEVKIRLAANGYMVKTGPWYVFPDLPGVFKHLSEFYAGLAQEAERAKGKTLVK